jgi:hypothetical protein
MREMNDVGAGRSGVKVAVMFVRVLAILMMSAAAGAVELSELPTGAREALEPAIVETTARFNADQDRLRQTPRVESVGPQEAPYMLRATYRQASADHAVVAVEPGAEPIITVRIRAVELEKRATNISMEGLQAEFAKAPWTKSPRGYLLDFRLRWNGSALEQLGEPIVHPSLSRGGATRAVQVLESGGSGAAHRR